MRFQMLEATMILACSLEWSHKLMPPVPVATAETSDLVRKLKLLLEAPASNLIITNYKAKNLKALLKVQELEMVLG